MREFLGGKLGKTRGFLNSTLFLSLFFIFFACAPTRVGNDLAEYMNQGILNISELENKSLMRYASVNCESCDISDEEIYKTLKDEVIPNYKRFLGLLKNINPGTDEVRQVHAVYIHGAETIYSGFKIKLIGLEKKDKDLIRAAEDKIDMGMMETYKWNKKLIALSKEHNVAQKQKK